MSDFAQGHVRYAHFFGQLQARGFFVTVAAIHVAASGNIPAIRVQLHAGRTFLQ